MYALDSESTYKLVLDITSSAVELLKIAFLITRVVIRLYVKFSDNELKSICILQFGVKLWIIIKVN